MTDRELDMQLGDALAEIKSYRLTRLQDGITIAGLLLDRDALKGAVAQPEEKNNELL